MGFASGAYRLVHHSHAPETNRGDRGPQGDGFTSRLPEYPTLQTEILQKIDLIMFALVECHQPASMMPVSAIAGSHAANIGVLGQFKESARGEAVRVFDDVAIQFVDLFSAMRIAQKVPCNRPQRIVIPDLVDRLFRRGFTTRPRSGPWIGSRPIRLGANISNRPILGHRSFGGSPHAVLARTRAARWRPRA